MRAIPQRLIVAEHGRQRHEQAGDEAGGEARRGARLADGHDPTKDWQ